MLCSAFLFTPSGSTPPAFKPPGNSQTRAVSIASAATTKVLTAIARAGCGPHAALILMAISIAIMVTTSVLISFKLAAATIRLTPVIRRRHHTARQRHGDRSQCKQGFHDKPFCKWLPSAYSACSSPL